MRAEVVARAPEEACGLVAGLARRSAQIFPVTNILHSGVRFQMDPQEQWNAFVEMEAHDLELLAIYHSHPSGPAAPSYLDIAQAAYPGVIYLIWSRAQKEWICRAFQIEGGRAAEISLRTIPGGPPHG
jgi:proteasome lid subunit RPN8/RPN11